MHVRVVSILTLSFLWTAHIASILPVETLNRNLVYSDQLQQVKTHMNDLKVEPIVLDVKENDVSDRKIQRKGFLATRPEALGTIVFCHGYTSSKYESFFFKTFFPNFNALAFDFRAHGELADGQYSTIGSDEVHDVAAAVDFVKNHPDMKGKPVIGFGFSMGAVSLLRSQARWQNLFDMLILDSPFDSSDICVNQKLDSILNCKLFGRNFKLPGKTLLMKAMYNERLSPVARYVFRMVTGFDPNQIPTKFMYVAPIDNAASIKIPCMFITCQNDTKVPVDSVKRLYQAVDAPYKRMWITQGIKHCSAYLTLPELYWYKMNKFIYRVLDGSTEKKEKIIDDRVTIGFM